MALSDRINTMFPKAYQDTLDELPEDQLEEKFCATLTRRLVKALFNAGDIETENNKISHKIRYSLEVISMRHQDENLEDRFKWKNFIRNRTALRMALEGELALRTTISDQPDSVKRISQQLESIRPGRYSFSNPTKTFPAVAPPADKPWKHD